MYDSVKKSLNICVGLLLSALLFYLFIKDVNKVQITENSGKGTGQFQTEDRIVFLQDVNGMESGDVVEIEDNLPGSRTSVKISKVMKSQTAESSYIILDAPLSRSFLPDQKAHIKFPRLQKALQNANYLWLFPALVFTIIALLIRSYRWKFFFPAYRELSFDSLWRSVCIGYMANNVLPFRMGEIVRAWFFSRREKRRISESFGTIVMERVFDIISILFVFLGFLFYFSIQKDVVLPAWLNKGAWVLAIISAVSLAFLIALRFKTKSTMRIVEYVIHPFPEKFKKPLLQMIQSFIEGLGIFSNFYPAFMAFSLSMVVWFDLAVAYYFVFLAVHIQASLLTSIFLIVALAFAVSIPAAPGFIGTFHYAGQQVLLIMGLKGNVEAYVLLAHAMAYIPVVILGFIFLSLEKLSLKDLRESIKYKETEKKSRI